jgi:hypothetical protein
MPNEIHNSIRKEVLMSNSISSHYASTANELKALEKEKATFQQQLKEASPSLKPLYIREIRKIGLELISKRQELDVYLTHNSSAARPDLRVVTLVIKKNHAKRELRIAPRIKNFGLGIAKGPFRIDLAVTIHRGSMTTAIVNSFQVPTGVVIYGEMVLQPFAFLDDVTLSQEYKTENMIVPLYYIDENPSCKYEFDCLVDVNNEVAESDESNNSFHVNFFIVTPQAIQRDKPFILEYPRWLKDIS